MLRVAWLAPENSTCKGDGWVKESLPTRFRILRSDEGGRRGVKIIEFPLGWQAAQGTCSISERLSHDQHITASSLLLT